MALLERLHPRHWDGRRLLQFLTGLALLALAFSAPSAAPAPAAPVAMASRAEVRTGVVSAANLRTAAAARPPNQDAAPVEECWHDASGYATVARPVDRAAAPAGAIPGVHGSRAPPLA